MLRHAHPIRDLRATTRPRRGTHWPLTRAAHQSSPPSVPPPDSIVVARNSGLCLWYAGSRRTSTRFPPRGRRRRRRAKCGRLCMSEGIQEKPAPRGWLPLFELPPACGLRLILVSIRTPCGVTAGRDNGAVEMSADSDRVQFSVHLQWNHRPVVTPSHPRFPGDARRLTVRHSQVSRRLLKGK